jgi:hypothetical protein
MNFDVYGVKKEINLTTYRMKKILILILIVTAIAGCENQNIDFPDFDYTAVYFPVQFPVRILSLGEDDIDNSLDKELKFHIGVAIGGMYENNRDWTVSYEVDESLCDNLGNSVKALPSSMYTLDPVNEVTIPSGSFSGLILVQLSEDFLTDSLSAGNHYVVPLRIIGTNADSILRGLPVVPDPDKRVISDWDASAPAKDFTLFMVKYVNELHGNFLRRGVDYGQDAFGNITDTATYHAQNVEQDEVVTLATVGRYAVHTNFTGSRIGDEYSVSITLDPESGEVSVEAVEDARYRVIGTGIGTYVTGGGSWGGKDRDIIYIKYIYRKGIYNHQVYDTLVFRDRGIAFEQFAPVVLE